MSAHERRQAFDFPCGLVIGRGGFYQGAAVCTPEGRLFVRAVFFQGHQQGSIGAVDGGEAFAALRFAVWMLSILPFG